MIELPRSMCRRLYAVLRRTFRKSNRSFAPVLELSTSEDGLRARVVDAEIAVEFQHRDSCANASVTLPFDALKTIAGPDDSIVALENGPDGQVTMRWNDRGVPQVAAFATPERAGISQFPTLPDRWAVNPMILATALDDAARTTASDSVRYALQKIQLRGRSGEVIATNGKELLVAGGFDLGFDDELLVPKLLALRNAEFARAEVIEVGRTADHVALRCGEWTFVLTIDTAGRFPDVHAIIPKASAVKSRCRLDRQDCEFLLHTVPRLPSHKEQFSPVTLDLNGKVTLRARASDQPLVTEVVLSRSHFEGIQSHLNLNGAHLMRAVQLGFQDIGVVNPDRPIVCREGQRIYLTMPLSATDAIGPTENALRLESTDVQPLKIFKPNVGKRTMTMPSTNGTSASATRLRRRLRNPTSDMNRVGLSALIEDAQALKEAARLLFSQSGRLAHALKKHRKQSRLMATTLKSLKQLQTIDA